MTCLDHLRPTRSTPGVTRPDWVLQVSAPLPPDAIDRDRATSTVTYANTKNANRVVVTINGGGDASTVGAAASTRSASPPAARPVTRSRPRACQNAPTFTSTQSRCGGPITLVVDESNSIGDTDIAHVRYARSRPSSQALAGTPVQIQIVRFDTTASILGAPGVDEVLRHDQHADVTALLAAVPQLDGSWPSGSGGTNWEDAMLPHVLRTRQRRDAPLPITPKTVVFFTDGVPNTDRQTKREDAVNPLEPGPPLPGWPPPSTGSGLQPGLVGASKYLRRLGTLERVSHDRCRRRPRNGKQLHVDPAPVHAQKPRISRSRIDFEQKVGATGLTRLRRCTSPATPRRKSRQRDDGWRINGGDGTRTGTTSLRPSTTSTTP